MRPQGKIKFVWNNELAYIIGLMVTDGNLSNDGRHLNITSKDFDIIKIFQDVLGIKNKISQKGRDKDKTKRYYFLQFGDKLFYNFLLSIGLMSRKSKIIGSVQIPDEYYFDFLRGHFDGDGTFYAYLDPRWKFSYMFYLVFMSASKQHIEWLRENNYKFLRTKGHISKNQNSSVYQLRYAKKEALQIIKRMYYKDSLFCLGRKRLKIEKALAIIDEHF